jgi:hypothetical protein
MRCLLILMALCLLSLTAMGQSYYNLDDSSTGWQNPPCGALPPPGCAGGNSTPTAWAQTYLNASPSIDGNSMYLEDVGTDYANIEFGRSVGANDADTYFFGSYYAYIVNTAPFQIFGQDMYLFSGSVRYMFGTQCGLNGTAVIWSLWNAGTTTWEPTSPAVPCPFTSGAWHQISFQAHRVPGDTSCGGVPCEYYDYIIQDGTKYNLNVSYPSGVNTHSDDRGMQFDVSSDSAGGTLGVYIDEMTFGAATGTSAPAFTSANNTSFTVGSAGSFTVAATGFPPPTFTETGALPPGITLTASGTLFGTPTGAGGVFPITITAANGISPNATQSFTITVYAYPVFTSATSSTFTKGQASSFDVTATGYPAPSIALTSGTLPAGVSFSDPTGVSPGILSGTPTVTGSYPLIFEALGLNSTVYYQDFTLTVTSIVTYPLTVTTGGTGAGTVTSSPAGISCPTICSENVNTGTQVTLTATASAGSIFSGWVGVCTGTAPCVVTMSAAMSVSAYFTLTAPAPSCTPPGGTYGATQSVACTDIAPLQCYNFTGAPAVNSLGTACSTGVLYTGAIPISASSTLYISAGGGGYANSLVATNTYNISTVGNVGNGNTIHSVQPPVPTGTDASAYQAVLAQNNQLLSGQTIIVGLGGTSGFDQETGTGACAPSFTAGFALWDPIVAAYSTSLILSSATEGGTNSFTPQCVFSQAQADATFVGYGLGANPYLPGQYVLQNGKYWVVSNNSYTSPSLDNTCNISTGTLTFTGAGPYTDGTCTFTLSSVSSGAHAPPQDGYCSANYTCGGCWTTGAGFVININNLGACTLTQLYESEPIPTEPPISAWQTQVIDAAIPHYNGKVGYIRPGWEGGEISILGVNSGLWPNYGSTTNQQRAQALSGVKMYDQVIMAAGPTMTVDFDMHIVGSDQTYADQEAQLGHDLCATAIGTNGVQVNDIVALQNPANYPLVSTNIFSGDWPYNFSRFSTNACGQTMYHVHQTLTGSTPLDCAANITGPLGPLPSGSTYCSAGFPGILPFLVSMCTTGLNGGTVHICDHIFEMYATAPTNNPNSGIGNQAWPAGDVLLALDNTTYCSTNEAQCGPTVNYQPQINTYQAAMSLFLGAGYRLGTQPPTNVSFTIGRTLCGAPNYYCSTTSTTNPGTVTALFTGTTGVNQIAYDTSYNPFGTDCYTRATDSTTLGGKSVGNNTYSGGDNDIMWSKNSDFVGTTEGGYVYLLNLNVSGNCAQVLNTGNITGSGGIGVPGPFGFSKVTDNVFYNIKNSTQIEKNTITLPYNKSYTSTLVYDVSNCPALSGLSGWTWSGILGISNGDTRFALSLSNTGGQGTGVWVVVYDTTLGCAVENTGVYNATTNPLGQQYWNFGAASPSGTLAVANTCTTGQNCTCSGGTIHDAQFSGDGTEVVISEATPAWTLGACAGASVGTMFSIWNVGTQYTQYCSANVSGLGGLYCGGHDSVGTSRMVNEESTGAPVSTRALSNVLTYQQYQTGTPWAAHGFWAQPDQADDYPYVQTAYGLLSSGQDSGCGNPNACPITGGNAIFADYPSAVSAYPPGKTRTYFGHTYSCNTTSDSAYATCGGQGDYEFGCQYSIMSVSQDGNWAMVASGMLLGLGNDSLGNPRCDTFIVHLQ